MMNPLTPPKAAAATASGCKKVKRFANKPDAENPFNRILWFTGRRIVASRSLASATIASS